HLGFKPKVSFEGEDIDAIKGLVSAGLGITIIPEITLVDNLPRSTVVVPLIEPNITRTVGMIVPTDRQLLPTEELFFNFLQDFFNPLEKFQRYIVEARLQYHMKSGRLFVRYIDFANK